MIVKNHNYISATTENAKLFFLSLFFFFSDIPLTHVTALVVFPQFGIFSSFFGVFFTLFDL